LDETVAVLSSEEVSSNNEEYAISSSDVVDRTNTMLAKERDRSDNRECVFSSCNIVADVADVADVAAVVVDDDDAGINCDK
jgi:hypothetical protein